MLSFMDGSSDLWSKINYLQHRVKHVEDNRYAVDEIQTAIYLANKLTYDAESFNMAVYKKDQPPFSFKVKVLIEHLPQVIMQKGRGEHK